MQSLAAVTFRPGAPADRAGVVALLDANSLPLDGVSASLESYVIADHSGSLVGVAGLERYGDDALLRSVAVDKAWRGSGLGTALVQQMLAIAASREVRTLWLLTTTADRWFPRFGFAVATREAVPPRVQQSREFQGACPASAIVMRRAV